MPGAPAHHREHGFANVNPSHPTAGSWTRFTLFVSRVFASTFTPRSASLAQVASDLGTIHDHRGAVTVTWVGHATLLIQLENVNVLTDPHWSDRASPVGFAGPRRVAPPGSGSRICLRSTRSSGQAARRRASTQVLRPARAQAVVRRHRDHRRRAGLAGQARAERADPSPASRPSTSPAAPSESVTVASGAAGSSRAGRSACTSRATRRTSMGSRRSARDWVPSTSRRCRSGPTCPRSSCRRATPRRRKRSEPSQTSAGSDSSRSTGGTFDLAEEPLEEPPQRLLSEARRLRLDLDRIWILKHGETRRW